MIVIYSNYRNNIEDIRDVDSSSFPSYSPSILGSSRWAVTKIRAKRLVRRRVKWDTLGSALKAVGLEVLLGADGKSTEKHGKIKENHGI